MTTPIAEERGRLTKYPEGSLRELLIFSFPLMISLVSENIMLFFDCLILAHYSLDAMNAATAASFFSCILQCGTAAIATIAEVFVGQFNGAKLFRKTAQPVWQMIWFAIFSSIIFIPTALWAGDYILSPYYREEFGLPYFRWILYFGPCFPMLAAFSAFFVGIGKARLVTSVVVIGNIINILLDLVLIFGVEDIIPSMGTKGAAIATGVSQLLQITILACFFFNKTHRKTYNTTACGLERKLFFQCCRVGFPNALSYMLEMTSWAIIARLMASIGPDYLTVMTVGQGLYNPISFSLNGLQRGVSIISSNFLAAKKWDKIEMTRQAGARGIYLFGAIFSLFMVFYPDPLIHQFLVSETSSAGYEHTFYLLRMTSIAIWFYIIFEGHSSITTGILVAAGDTPYVLLINCCYVLIFTFLPIYILTHHFSFSPIIIWTCVSLASLLHASLSLLRFRQNKWITQQSIIHGC